MIAVEDCLDRYRAGWFPMYFQEVGRVEWVQPHARALMPLDDRFCASRSLRAKVRRGVFAITCDQAFERVIRECAADRSEGTWLADEIIELFLAFHREGHAHSIEAWTKSDDDPPRLVGGLYGLAIGAVFCGESMFSRPRLGGTDASKVCLVHLVQHLRRQGFQVLDSQIANEHMAQFGQYEVRERSYQTLLRSHAGKLVPWGVFSPSPFD